MLLQAFCPKTAVDGFDVEVVRHDQNLLADSTWADYFEDRFLELKAQCDGTNPLYPIKASLTLIITRYRKISDVGISLQVNAATVGTMLLHPSQMITSATITEMRQANFTSAILILQIKDGENNNATHSAVYALARESRYLH